MRLCPFATSSGAFGKMRCPSIVVLTVIGFVAAVWGGAGKPTPKRAFVGAFTLDGATVEIALPQGNWVSAEQVRRECRFRGWRPPLTAAQMATLARALEAEFAVDLLAAAMQARKRWTALVVLRVVSADLQAIVHLTQERVPIAASSELPRVVEQVAGTSLAALPSRFATATVQVREGDRRVHLMAREGTWRKGTEVLLYRIVDGQPQPLATARLVTTHRAVDGTTWLLEAELTAPASVRGGDKAIAVFRLPAPFSRWQ